MSPLLAKSLRKVCAARGREISGCGFVILDYEELGAFCDQDCGDKRFRSYLYDMPADGTFYGDRSLLDQRLADLKACSTRVWLRWFASGTRATTPR
jgi:hypothetical protein